LYPERLIRASKLIKLAPGPGSSAGSYYQKRPAEDRVVGGSKT